MKVHENVFRENTARANSTSQTRPFLGYGGAVHVLTGAAVECKRSLFLSNRAYVGGAVFVHDSAFDGESLNFSRNAAFKGGVGGAAAVEISRGKNIPFLATANEQRMLFQCDVCDFDRNDGSLAGGLFSPVAAPSTGGRVSRSFARARHGSGFDVRKRQRSKDRGLPAPAAERVQHAEP